MRQGRPVYVIGGNLYGLELARMGGFEGKTARYQDTLDAEQELRELIEAKDD